MLWIAQKLYNREGASVSYTLPATFVSASLQIFDVTGKPVKVIKLDNGSSNVVEVSRSELGYGTFIYTLFVDGKKADILKKIYKSVVYMRSKKNIFNFSNAYLPVFILVVTRS